MGDNDQLPMYWPSAWPYLWRPLRDRACFVGLTMVLTGAGVQWTGDLREQWWLPLLPLALCIGPATLPSRVRRSLRRAASVGQLHGAPGRLVSGAAGTLFVPSVGSQHPVALPASMSSHSFYGRLDSFGVLVWQIRWWSRFSPAAIVLEGQQVAYLGLLRRSNLRTEGDVSTGLPRPNSFPTIDPARER